MASDFTPGVDHTPSAGTAPYMSPAVASGEAEYTRSDIYALGALLYEMLTGCSPYSGNTTAQILEQIRAGPPRRIRDLNGGASPGLVMIAEGAMVRVLRESQHVARIVPEPQYETALEVLGDLFQTLDGDAAAAWTKGIAGLRDKGTLAELRHAWGS